MELKRLNELIDRFSSLHILVVGDYFLDKYLLINRQLSEISLETGLEAYQVVEIITNPGAAGNVAANLAALDARVIALGAIGKDGHGYELQRALADRCIDIHVLSKYAGMKTPTYTKPLILEPDGLQHEIERQDIKNRLTLPLEVEIQIIDNLRSLVPEMDGVVVVDQVQEVDCGVISRRVRDTLEEMAVCNPNVFFAVDSRVRIGAYHKMVLKPNCMEAVAVTANPAALGPLEEISEEIILESGEKLHAASGKPVFLTRGEHGVLVITEHGIEAVPAFPVHGEIDPVGAGDSFLAGMVLAMCSSANPAEAALIGNLVSAVTIQKIGMTGTATPEQLREVFLEFNK